MSDMVEREKSFKIYEKRSGRKWLVLAAAALLLLGLALFSLCSGSIRLTLGEVLSALFFRGSEEAGMVIWGIRLPRTAAAVLVGSGLAVSGAVMQCVLRNPLASASTLGVSQGAAFGAALGIVVFGGGVINSGSSAAAVEVNHPGIVTLCAFLFGMISTGVILALSRMKRDLGPGGLVLAGTALSSLFAGGSALLQYFADDTKLGAVVFWTFGNLGSAGREELLTLAVLVPAAFLYFMGNRWNYNAMRSAPDTAKSLGVNTRAVTLAGMTVCSLTAAAAVAFVGIISFIGLAAPHIMRRFVGEDYRFLIPCSAVAGALLLTGADTFSRLIVSPVILPVGAVTSFLGAPVFLMLLMKGGQRG